MTQPQTVLITGATAGIGRHAALHLARRGHRVIASGRRSDALAALQAAAQAEGLTLETLVLDVTSSASIAAAHAAVDALTQGRGLDALVNNAGYGQFGVLEELSDAAVRRQFETNVFGLLAVTRAFLPAMRARGAGRIVNVSSVGGRVAFPLAGAYHATKYAVEALSDTLRLELRGFGVKVAIIEPGPIQSDFADTAKGSVTAYRDAASPYASLLARGDAIMATADRYAKGPRVISKAIAHAIESRLPSRRYVAPFSSRVMLALLNTLPTFASDWLVARAVFGIKRQAPASPARGHDTPATRTAANAA